MHAGGPTVLLQPIVSLVDGTRVGAEALSRFPADWSLPPDVVFEEASSIGAGIDLAAAIKEAIGSDKVEVLTGTEITEENQSQAQESLNFLTLFLSIFALIALFVGSFVIYNVFSISAAQRERENALLRAIGASRAQVTRSLFIEALVVGIGGSLLGCLGGVLQYVEFLGLPVRHASVLPLSYPGPIRKRCYMKSS